MSEHSFYDLKPNLIRTDNTTKRLFGWLVGWSCTHTGNAEQGKLPTGDGLYCQKDQAMKITRREERGKEGVVQAW